MRRRLALTRHLLLTTIAIALGVVVLAGQAVAYRPPASLTVEERLDTADDPAEPTARAGRIVNLDLPVYPTLDGTDAGLVTTPAP